MKIPVRRDRAATDRFLGLAPDPVEPGDTLPQGLGYARASSDELRREGAIA